MQKLLHDNENMTISSIYVTKEKMKSEKSKESDQQEKKKTKRVNRLLRKLDFLMAIFFLFFNKTLHYDDVSEDAFVTSSGWRESHSVKIATIRKRESRRTKTSRGVKERVKENKGE